MSLAGSGAIEILTLRCSRVVFTAAKPGITGVHLHPKDVGAAILSVDQADEWDEWPWAGPRWRDYINTSEVTD